MTITDDNMTSYYFGERKIWPKPELNTPYQVIDHFSSLLRSLHGLEQIVDVSSGRQDHLVKSLDTLAFALQEAMFKTMVLREALTGFQTRGAQQTSEALQKEKLEA